MTSPARRMKHLAIPGPAGIIEGVFQTRVKAPHPVSALVCHPHPLHGGTLHNKVVHRVANVFEDEGAAVLRFNFRGVGKSDGRHDHGRGELEDAHAAFTFLKVRCPTARRWLAGFSFGSWIAARLAAVETELDLLMLVAPPVSTSSFEGLRSSPVPKLIVQGTLDEISPLPAIRDEFPTWMEPKLMVEVPGATHFFHKQLGELADAVKDGIQRLGLESPPPPD